MFSQCNARMKISFPGLIFAQYKSYYYCPEPPPVYQDLSMHQHWPVKNATVELPIKMRGNLKRPSGNSSSPLGAQNKDLGASTQMLLTEVKLHLRCKLLICPTVQIFFVDFKNNLYQILG